ncbi:MAG: hypothetical protein EZS28_021088, partial [Streblomastix strix]
MIESNKTQPNEQSSFEQLLKINKKIKYMKKVKQSTSDIMRKLTKVLQTIIIIEDDDKSQRTDEFEIILKDVLGQIDQISDGIIQGQKDVDSAMQTGLVTELIGLIKRTPSDQISALRILPIYQISQKGKAEQTHKLYQQGILQTLAPKLRINNKNAQLFILLTFIYIIKNGWKQIRQSQQQQQQQQSNLQQLLNQQHPYLDNLQNEGVIQMIVTDVLASKEVDDYNKRVACKLLDSIYIEGIVLPKDLQEEVLTNFSQQFSSEDEQEGTFGALSYLAVNKGLKNINITIMKLLMKDFSILLLIMEKTADKEVESIAINSLLRFLSNVYINGSWDSQYLIKKDISAKIMKKLEDLNDYKNEAKILESSIIHPEIMNKLMMIRRSVLNKNRSYINDLIKAGLMDELLEEIEKLMNSKVNKYNDKKDQEQQRKNQEQNQKHDTGQIPITAQIEEEEPLQRPDDEDQKQLEDPIDDDLTELKRVKEDSESQSDSENKSKSASDRRIKNINEKIVNIQYYGRTSADEQENESDKEKEADIERDWEGLNGVENYNEFSEQEESNEIEGDGEEGLMLIAIEIIKQLIHNNQQGNNLIVFDSEFIDGVLRLLNDNPLPIIKSHNLSPIWYLIKQLTFDQKRKLIPKGIVPIMLKMMTSDDKDVVFIARRILDGLFSIGMEGLQGGEQHPLRKPLEDDGTINELIKQFNEVEKGDDKYQVREVISQILASLNKAYPLPQDCGQEIINQLKDSDNHDQQYLDLLAECPDNYDMILDNEYERKMLNDEQNLLPSLQLLETMLLVGSEFNGKILTYALQDKVKILTYFSHLNQILDKDGEELSQLNKEETRMKAQQVLKLMKWILRGKQGPIEQEDNEEQGKNKNEDQNE